MVQAAAAARKDVSPEESAADEELWQIVRQAYSIDAAYIMLNADANNVPARTVHEAHLRHLQMVGSAPFINTRRSGIAAQAERVRQRLARLANVAPEEVALTRNTTEGLNIVIAGMNLPRAMRWSVATAIIRLRMRHWRSARRVMASSCVM